MESDPGQQQAKVEVVEAATTGEGVRLFGAPAIALASFIGTPVAGGVLLAINGMRVGQKGGAFIGLLMGGLLAFSLLGLFPYVPAGTPLWAMLPVGAVGMFWIAKVLQGDLLARRQVGGTGKEMGIAVLVGAVTLAVLWVAVLPLVTVKKPAGVPLRTLVVTEKQTVSFAAPVTEEDARRVGAALVGVKYFDQSGQAKQVLVGGDEQGRLMALFPADPARAKDPEMIKSMAVLAQGFVRAGVAMPFTIRLVGPDGKMLNEAKVAAGAATTRAAAGAPTTQGGLQPPFGTP